MNCCILEFTSPPPLSKNLKHNLPHSRDVIKLEGKADGVLITDSFIITYVLILRHFNVAVK
jgi:hypothetical protein